MAPGPAGQLAKAARKSSATASKPERHCPATCARRASASATAHCRYRLWIWSCSPLMASCSSAKARICIQHAPPGLGPLVDDEALVHKPAQYVGDRAVAAARHHGSSVDVEGAAENS